MEQNRMNQLTKDMTEHVCNKICKNKCQGENCIFKKLLNDICTECSRQLPKFEVGDIAYLVDFEKKKVNWSTVNECVCIMNESGIEFMYESDLLDFHSDDVGVIVFKSHKKACEALQLG